MQTQSNEIQADEAQAGIPDLLVKIGGRHYLIPAESLGAPLADGDIHDMLDRDVQSLAREGNTIGVEFAMAIGGDVRHARQCQRQARQCERTARQCERSARAITPDDRSARAITPDTREARQCERTARQCDRQARQCDRQARQCERSARAITPDAPLAA